MGSCSEACPSSGSPICLPMQPARAHHPQRMSEGPSERTGRPAPSALQPGVPSLPQPHPAPLLSTSSLSCCLSSPCVLAQAVHVACNVPGLGLHLCWTVTPQR